LASGKCHHEPAGNGRDADAAPILQTFVRIASDYCRRIRLQSPTRRSNRLLFDGITTMRMERAVQRETLLRVRLCRCHKAIQFDNLHCDIDKRPMKAV